MALTELQGMQTNQQTVRIERGPVKVFAAAVLDARPEYDGDDALVPPTFPFVLPFWGSQGEGGAAGLPLERLRGPGRMLLHGEQGFVIHRNPRVGDTLTGTTTITDVYEKARGDTGRMEFYVTDTVWVDAATQEPVVTSRFTLVVNVRGTG